MQIINDKIESIMKEAINKLKDMVDSSTVIGSPIILENTKIIPITKVTVGFVAGGGEYSQNIPPKNAQKEYPFAGGSSAGISVVPIGFLICNEEKFKLIKIDSNSTFEDAIKLASDVAKNLRK